MYKDRIETLITKIQRRGDLPHVTVERQLELLEQLSQFELGRFLLMEGRLNGYWTHYAVNYPDHPRGDENSLAHFLLTRAPTALATQERFRIFKAQIQSHLREGARLASIPCGMMGEFLDLNFSGLTSISLHGIDIDPETLDQAKQYAREKGLNSLCHFSAHDAWNLQRREEFDLIASNGLSIYEPDDVKVIALYREFHQALKKGGVLIASYLTPPPIPGRTTEWKLDQVHLPDALLQKIVLADILEPKWQIYRTEAAVREQLKQAGFSEAEILYDKAHIMPTVIAKK